MWNSVEVLVYLGLVGILALWFFLPLVPAVLLYWLFPNQQMAATGVLANFKINAAGAFAGYLVLFAAMMPFVGPAENYVGSFLHTCWTITGRVKIVDANDTDMHYPSLFEAIRMNTKPDMISFDDPEFLITVPAGPGGYLPPISLRILQKPEFAPQELRVDAAGVDRDWFYKTIKISGPIIIKTTSVNASYDARPQ